MTKRMIKSNMQVKHALAEKWADTNGAGCDQTQLALVEVGFLGGFEVARKLAVTVVSRFKGNPKCGCHELPYALEIMGESKCPE